MRRLSLAAALAAGTLALTACSGTSGTAVPAAAGSSSAAAAAATSTAPPALEAAKVGSAVAEAAKQATSVRVKGTMADDGNNINLDLQLNQDSASGTVVKDGLEIPVLRVGDKYFFRFTESLVKQAGIPASVGKKLTGKWVPSTAQIGAGIADAFKVFLDYKSFTENTVGELASSTFTGGEPTTLGGVPALNFTSTDGTATVAADAPHYLLRMQDPKSGTIEFSDWNKPATVQAPPASEIYSGPGA